jgi:aquaporin Z
MTDDPRPEPALPPTPLGHAPDPDGPSTFATLVAEAFGSFLVVLLGVGTTLLAAGLYAAEAVVSVEVGVVASALAAGLALTVAAYAFGPVSGGHFLPITTLGLAAAGRFPWRSVPPYLVAQAIGAIAATTVLVLVGLFGPQGWLESVQDAGFASNGFGTHSPAGFTIGAAILVETVLAALFVIVVLATTHVTRGSGLAGLAIGLAFAALQFVSIPVDGGGLNPARSLATAVFGGTTALWQLWVFLVFPIVGALVAGVAYRALFDGSRRG